MALTVVLNGESRSFEELEAGATLMQLVEALGLKPDRIALEQNGEIAARRGWGTAAIAPGDRLELVHFVGGGSVSGALRLGVAAPWRG